jgi:FSR family fosmidomycin resistance protein-like MFS transporter
MSRPWWRLTLFVFVMLVVEFLDEFAYSALEAARPLIRDSFGLTYVQLGLITTIPVLVAIVVEPIVGIFADSGKRRLLLVAGGIAFGAGLLIEGFAPTFFIFMIGETIQAPASGIFINIAQASLMDDAPQRRENRMALWTFSGSLAVVTGPLLLAAMIALGSDWRPFFISTGVISIVVALWILRLPASRALRSSEDEFNFRENLSGVMNLLRKWAVWRWLVLLEFSDLMLDVLFALLALYMVDVAGVTQAQAGLAIAAWTGVGLVGDFLVIPILERVRGLVFLRMTALIEMILFSLFLLTDPFAGKLVLLGLMGLFNPGWYAILQAKLYDSLGEQSGAVLIVGNAAGLFGALLPLFLGLVAQRYGLDAAMWILLAGPIALLSGLPRD